MRLVIFHSEYGCDTGCCGHTVAILPEGSDDPWDGQNRHFEFNHPYLLKTTYDKWGIVQRPYSDRLLEWAQELVTKTFGAEHVKDLDWDNCIVSVD